VGGKAYMSSDMEGTAGVSGWPETQPGHMLYPRAQSLMIGEVNAAIAGAFEAGVDEMLVNDSHDGMRNLSPEEIDPRVRLLLGAPKRHAMVDGAAGHDVALFTGYHAAAGAPGNLAHTMTLHLVEVRLNGTLASETFWNAGLLGEWGVPVGLVTGDEVLGRHIAEILPWAVFVPVKRPVSLTASAGLSPKLAREAIRAGAGEAIGRMQRGELRLFQVPGPYELTVTFTEQDRAARANVCPRSRHIDTYTVAYTGETFEEAYMAMRTLTAIGAMG